MMGLSLESYWNYHGYGAFLNHCLDPQVTGSPSHHNMIDLDDLGYHDLGHLHCSQGKKNSFETTNDLDTDEQYLVVLGSAKKNKEVRQLRRNHHHFRMSKFLKRRFTIPVPQISWDCGGIFDDLLTFSRECVDVSGCLAIFSGTLLGSVAFDGVEVGLGVYTSSWGRALAAVQPPVTGWTKCWTPHMEPPKDWKLDNVAELLFRSMSVSAQLCHVNIKHVSNIEPKPPWLSWRSLHFCLFKHFWSTAVSPGCRPQGPLGKPQLARPMLRRKTLWSRTKVKKVKFDECSFEAQLGFWWSRDVISLMYKNH